MQSGSDSHSASSNELMGQCKTNGRIESAETDMVSLSNGVAKNMLLNDSKQQHSDQSKPKDVFDLGLDLQELYKLAIKFYKNYELKAFIPTYEERNKLAALTLQAKHGPFADDKEPERGAFDFVGRDRRLAWQSLGSMSAEESMRQFVSMLHSLCSTFMPYLEAHIQKQEEMKRETESESQKLLLEEQQRQQDQCLKQSEMQKKAVQEILNQTTYSQFLSYARDQYPDDAEKQQQLIHRLQEQHYQQYMQQMLEIKTPINHMNGFPLVNDSNGTSCTDENDTSEGLTGPASIGARTRDDLNHSYDSQDESVVIEPAKMWTRPDIDAFKEAIRSEGKEGMITVNHGEVVTIKVPTHENGNCIFFEFCTQSFDIGFGLSFEWTEFPGNQVSVHVTESDEEEEDDEDIRAETGEDCEKVVSNDKNIEVLIPVLRRDSHEEVFVGSHSYPGRGVYHLKFDNSYSLWRSKTLFYRVYYSSETSAGSRDNDVSERLPSVN